MKRCETCFGPMLPLDPDHTPLDCMTRRLAVKTAECASWKEAWFRQREATGKIALSEHARGKLEG